MAVKERLKGEKIFEKSLEVIPGGVNSPARAFIGLGIPPLIAEKGKGDTITDVEERSYIDYCMSWGALLHGHAPERVVQKTCQRIKDGSSFGIATAIEEKLARKITEAVPSVEQVRFVSSGTEAVMSAVRVARGFTSRSLILKFNGNYHGHSDAFLMQAGSGLSELNSEASSEGVPEDVIKNTLSLPYNDIASMKKVLRNPIYSERIAAVVLEPIAANMGVIPATEDFLSALREETQNIGSLLIFDEVISGFRVGYGGAQELYKISPDLTCFGKIVGGGFPAAAFGGKREIMQKLAPIGGVYQAGTLSGNPVAMEAGLIALEEASVPGFYEELERKMEVVTAPIKTALFHKGITACIQQSRGMFTLFWGVKKASCFEDLKELDKSQFNRYFRFMLSNGVYLSPSPYEACFVSAAHTEEHLERTRDLIMEFIEQC